MNYEQVLMLLRSHIFTHEFLLLGGLKIDASKIRKRDRGEDFELILDTNNPNRIVCFTKKHSLFFNLQTEWDLIRMLKMHELIS